MIDNPHPRTIESISLDVIDQAPGRTALVNLFPEREAIWLRFLLIPAGERIEVLLQQTDNAGLYVGSIGTRNREKLEELMRGEAVIMRGLIEWSSHTPKVRFIPPYSTR